MTAVSANCVRPGFVRHELDWRLERDEHPARIESLMGEHMRRRERGETHPVYDFLFEYYSYRPSHLFKWSPGLGVYLEGAGPADFPDKPWAFDCDGGWIDAAHLPLHRRESWEWILRLLEVTAERPPVFACGGLHEWAMVYRGEVRHAAVPLRMQADDLAAFVESQAISCSHFDAFRFFTPAARPLNRVQPSKESRHTLEQRGCLHANMDLYKWAYKIAPWGSSILLADCLELAMQARELDMQASPYDLRSWGLEPVKMETTEGRAAFTRGQMELAEKAVPLRRRLIAEYRTALSLQSP
ncbi:MAG: hypothetical protein SFU85_01650 [Candidatus Methylacidiphilales bacterium]|nr:hypothetical protein [Candidatus Methylacidiphilales bacterium]